jgi:hypothetical protein
MKFLRMLAGVSWLLKFTLTLAVKRVWKGASNAMPRCRQFEWEGRHGHWKCLEWRRRNKVVSQELRI